MYIIIISYIQIVYHLININIYIYMQYIISYILYNHHHIIYIYIVYHIYI